MLTKFDSLVLKEITVRVYLIWSYHHLLYRALWQSFKLLDRGDWSTVHIKHESLHEHQECIE